MREGGRKGEREGGRRRCISSKMKKTNRNRKHRNPAITIQHFVCGASCVAVSECDLIGV
jgi:hypothetical protein